MSFTVSLLRDALLHEHRTPQGDEKEISRPADPSELLRFWHYQLLEVAPDVTLGSLFSLLRQVKGIEILSPMLSCDVAAFLAEEALPLDAPPLSDIDYLEVYNTAWLDGTTRDSRGNKIACPPYHITRDFHGWGILPENFDDEDSAGENPSQEVRKGSVSIDFLPVNMLSHLPLRYNPAISFARSRHGRDPILETEISITFGEFVQAILWEVGFLGTPGNRDEESSLFQEVTGALKEELRFARRNEDTTSASQGAAVIRKAE